MEIENAISSDATTFSNLRTRPVKRGVATSLPQFVAEYFSKTNLSSSKSSRCPSVRGLDNFDASKLIALFNGHRSDSEDDEDSSCEEYLHGEDDDDDDGDVYDGNDDDDF